MKIDRSHTVSEAVASRRSVRAFLDKPVDRDVLVRVLDKARRAPSGGNVQPWHGVVVGGEALRSLIATVAAKMSEGSPECSPSAPMAQI